ncbi:glycosyltransferase family 4 protein [Sporosarcina highlanderae]|uniref:Glycosyltransferase family 4 protein n=1 Tax=Sporosarcina highlanderae TaxID=3035916 RepID=A0ABT8JXZ9_9BACL|nr:glycosyltransferase family 4 protein [Sporosarcina highlanderae]MDN4609014.1 glycosyltransferase family 4 protein [Sporosarcina highlanderae]
MTEKSKSADSFIPDPYLVSATDEFYGIDIDTDKDNISKKKSNSRNKKPLVSQKKTKTLRILLTTFWDYPAVGGLQNYIYSLKAGLESLGHKVDVIAPNLFTQDNRKGLNKEIKVKTKQFYIDRYGSFNEEIVKENVRLISYEMKLEKMNLEKYDLIHAQDRFTATVLSRVNEKYQKPILFTPHGFMTQRKLDFNLIQQESVEESFYLALDRLAVRTSSHIITLCELFRPLLKDLGAKDSKMTTVYTGIDFKLKKKSEKKKETKMIITCVSRLRPRKGHKYLFEALALIRQKLKNVEIWIVGDGEMRDELGKQVKALNLTNVVFLGERKDVPQLLASSTIFVLPTTSDTLPIAIIEAMFAKKPILTTYHGGIPELITDNHSGLLVEPGEPKMLAEKLEQLLSDQSLRDQLSQNAKEFAENNLTRSIMVKKIESIYVSLVSKEMS